MGDRFFPATAMGGRLYLDGIEETYCDEAVADMLVTRVGHRKARTEAELLAVIKESDLGLPTVRVWICEGLEALARSPSRQLVGPSSILRSSSSI